MKTMPNVLVVCGRNKRRSKTAETIFRNAQAFRVQAVGLSPKSPNRLTNAKMEWADVIMVMEDQHKKRILEQYQAMVLPPIFVLHIADDYEYMEKELVELLQESIPNIMTYEYFPDVLNDRKDD